MSEDVKVRRKPTRRVFARLKWVDVGTRRFCFELTKEGLRVHIKCSRRKDALVIPFERLTDGGGHEWFDGGVPVRFSISGKGVELRRGTSRRTDLVDFATLSNLARPQPELFVA